MLSALFFSLYLSPVGSPVFPCPFSVVHVITGDNCHVFVYIGNNIFFLNEMLSSWMAFWCVFACCLVKLHSLSAVDFGVAVCLLQSVTTPSGSVVSSQSLMLSVTFIVHRNNAMRLQSVCKVYVVKLLNLTASQRSLLGLQSLVLSPLHRDIVCPRGPEYFSTRSPPISHDKIWKVKGSSCCTLLLPFISAYGSLVLCYILFLLKHIVLFHFFKLV